MLARLTPRRLLAAIPALAVALLFSLHALLPTAAVHTAAASAACSGFAASARRRGCRVARRRRRRRRRRRSRRAR